MLGSNFVVEKSQRRKKNLMKKRINKKNRNRLMIKILKNMLNVILLKLNYIKEEYYLLIIMIKVISKV